jgi:drug/metabolite transporter (DMT)-like permease
VSGKPINRAMTPAEWAMLLALSVLWGGSFFFVGVAVKALPPFTIVLMRVGFAALILNVVILALGKRMPFDRSVWRAFLGMGLLNNVAPFCLIVWGQAHAREPSTPLSTSPFLLPLPRTGGGARDREDAPLESRLLPAAFVVSGFRAT